MKRIFTLLAFFSFMNTTFSQLTMTKWTFDAVASANTGVSPVFSVGSAVADAGVRTTGSLFTALHAAATSVWSNPSGNGSAKSLSGNGWAAEDYFQFQTTASGCSGISITWDQIASSTGPKSWKVQYSTDGTAYTDVPNTITNSTYNVATDSWSTTAAVNLASARTVDLSTITSLNNAANIYFRLMVVTGSTSVNGGVIATTGTSRVDNFTIAGSVITPVSLKSFQSSLINNKVSLNWNTTNEINVDGFIIERSDDGNSYTNIGFVAAKNSSINSYAFNDVLQVKKATYYRLKITDKDGSFKYSSVIVMNAKTAIKLDVYPNPAINTLVITHSKSSENSVLKIINIDGKNMLSQNIQNGATQSTIDVSKLIKGNYLVVLENDGARSAAQFVKQ